MVIIIAILLQASGTAFGVNDSLLLSSKDSKDKSLVNQLVELKSKSSQLKKDLGKLDDRIDALDLKIEEVQTKLTETELDLSTQTETLNKRAATLYKEGEGFGSLHILFGAQSIYDMVTRIDFLNYIIERDTDMIVEIRTKRKQYIELKENYLKDRQEIVILKEEKVRSLSRYVTVKEKLKKRMLLATQNDLERVELWMDKVKEIEIFLEGRGSPIAPFSSHFVLAGKNHGINPKLIVAISGIESSFGLNNIAPYNAWGRKAKGGGYKSYKSWKEAIWDQAYYLKTSYIDKGLVTVDQIAPKYCPPNQKHWAERVKYFMGII